MNIAIVGIGNVGAALGRGFTTAGHDVIWGSRHPEGTHQVAPVVDIRAAAAEAEVVVLAVPFAAVEETVAALGDVTARIIVDPTNPLGRLPQGAASAADHVASLAPGARVVKAFNTMGWETMADPVIDGRRAACLLCGDDQEAKDTVKGLAADLGFEPVDAGGLKASRHVEALAGVWVHLALRAGFGRGFAFAVLHRDA